MKRHNSDLPQALAQAPNELKPSNCLIQIGPLLAIVGDYYLTGTIRKRLHGRADPIYTAPERCWPIAGGHDD